MNEDIPSIDEVNHCLAAQRASRMMIIKAWLETQCVGDCCDAWTSFLNEVPQAKDWFDAQGYPVTQVNI
jgi:hypothetical protein